MLIIKKHEYTVEKKAIKKKRIEKIILLYINPNMIKISAQNLLAGGTPIFIVIINAQNNLKIGNKFILPFDKTKDRELEKSYSIFAIIKRAALEIP